MSNFIVYNDWRDGINDTAPPYTMKDTELRQCDNIDIDGRGGADWRKGCAIYNYSSFAAEVDQLIEWELSNGEAIKVCCSNKKLYILYPSQEPLLMLPDLASNTIGYAIYKDCLYFVDGSKFYVWGQVDYSTQSGSVDIAIGQIVKNKPVSTGTNPGIVGHFYKAKAAITGAVLATANYGDTAAWEDVTYLIIPNVIREVIPNTDSTNYLTPIKRCKYLLWHPQSYRFFAAGDSENPTALYFSEPDKPNFFKEINCLYPTTANGPITGLQNFVKTVMVSYKNSWRAFSGTFVGIDAVWKELSIPSGCVAQDAAALTPYSLTFLSDDGVYSISPGIINDDVVMVVSKDLYNCLTSNKVEGIIKSMVHKETAKMCYSDGRLYLAYGDDNSSPKNNKVLVMNWDQRSFTRYTGWQVNSWCKTTDGQLLFSTKNYVLKTQEGYTDIDPDTGTSKTIQTLLATKPYSLGSPSQSFMIKYVKNLYLSALQHTNTQTANLDIAIYSDYQTSRFQASVTDTAVTALTTDVNESLVWGRAWGKLYGFTELVTQQAQVNRMGYRHQIVVQSNIPNNRVTLYSFGFEFDGLDATTAATIPVTQLLTD